MPFASPEALDALVVGVPAPSEGEPKDPAIAVSRMGSRQPLEAPDGLRLVASDDDRAALGGPRQPDKPARGPLAHGVLLHSVPRSRPLACGA